MSTLELRGMTKRYPDGTVAVEGFDLEVADGEFVIFVGPSGCGKSTALRMIAGLEEITDGELLIDGVVVNDLEPSERDIAMVFQNYALYPNLSVRENLGFALRVAGTPKPEARERVDEAARILDLEPFMDRLPGQLSGGQRQRVAMGRAIVRSPRAFLMDEPLSNLDAKLRVHMRTEVAMLQQRLATTTIYVTHDQTEAMTLGDRVVVLKDGKVQQIGSPQDLYERPVNHFVAGFIGSPPMSFVPATVRDGRLELPFGSVPASRDLTAAADGRQLLAGMRPEHFEDARVAGERPGLRFTRTPVVVEALGAEDYAYFDEGEHEVVARLDRASDARPGVELELLLDASRALLFDADTGDRIAADTAVAA